MEGAPSVSAALRALRESPSSSPDTPPPPAAVRAAAELLLAYVTNALQDPRNPRVHRVRSGNPAFQRALGRLGGCEGAMTAIGFEPRDRGTVFVLGEVGAGAGKEREEVSIFLSWLSREQDTNGLRITVQFFLYKRDPPKTQPLSETDSLSARRHG